MIGARGRTRTDTVEILSLLPLPLGYSGRKNGWSEIQPFSLLKLIVHAESGAIFSLLAIETFDATITSISVD